MLDSLSDFIPRIFVSSMSTHQIRHIRFRTHIVDQRTPVLRVRILDLLVVVAESVIQLRFSHLFYLI